MVPSCDPSFRTNILVLAWRGTERLVATTVAMATASPADVLAMIS